MSTTLEQRDGRLLLNGRKFYSTGSLFADWILTGARRGEEAVALAVPTSGSGVTCVDDWNGFGTRTFGVAGASSPRDDALVQRVVGRIGSIRSAVESATLDAVRRLSAADDVPA